MLKVEVVPHDPRWRDAFEAEAKRVADALGENALAVHHVGSTAIPEIYAKPVIDILVEVRDVAGVDVRGPSMEALGYEVMGEYGIPGRRYFRKDDGEGIRTHHVHAFEAGSAEAVRHLAFRDYMIAHPADAQSYSELKRRLADEHPQNIDGYMDGKDGFIKGMDVRAARWRASRPVGNLESQNMRESYRSGAVGALMDEYERAASELARLVERIPDEDFARVVDAETRDEDCRSAQTIMSHVVGAAYGYADYLREQFSVESARPPRRLLSRTEALEQLGAALRYTAETLEGRWEMSYEEIARIVIKTRWGPVYDAEGLLEHAVVHVLRHRRQIERFIARGLIECQA